MYATKLPMKQQLWTAVLSLLGRSPAWYSQSGKSKAEKSLQLQLACYFTLLVVGYCYFRDELKICFKFDFHNVHVVAVPEDHKTIKTVVLWLLVVLSGFCILFSLEPQ